MKLCSIEDCIKPSRKRGWCQTHYSRWRSHGNPITVAKPNLPKGPDHYRWLGDLSTYTATHVRMRRTKGKASNHACVDCGSKASHWSYDRADTNEKFGLVGAYYVPYSTDFDHYEPRCVRCHLKLDHPGKVYD